MRHSAKLLPAVALVLLLAAATLCRAQLPASKGAPEVGQKAPDFTLPDATGKHVKLSELLAPAAADASGAPAAQKKGSYVLLIFYRGYW